MSSGIVSAAYIGAAVLFILSLGGLSNQESAKRAVWYGILGMAIAVFVTIFGPGVYNIFLILTAILVGSYAGYFISGKVQMTEMPQLVAALHSFVGLAAVFIGLNAEMMLNSIITLRDSGLQMNSSELTGFGEKLWQKDSIEIGILKAEVFLGIFIGAITFTGSIVAFGKLAGKLDGAPKKLKGGHYLNAMSLFACLILGWMYLDGAGIWSMIIVTIISGFIGWHLIMGIGGADMPVVVSMLNSIEVR